MTDQPQVWIEKRPGKRAKVRYYVRWIDGATHKVRCKAVGTDAAKARDAQYDLKRQLNEGTFTETRRVSWSAFAEEHVGMIRGREHGGDVARSMRFFAEHCEPAGPLAVSYAMLEKFSTHLYERGNSAATVNRRLGHLRTAFNRAAKRRYIKRNPMDGWEWDAEEEKIPRALSDDEKRVLLHACPTLQWRTFVLLALRTGCRCSELLRLAWGRVRFDHAELQITETKGHRDRVQPLDGGCVTALKELLPSTLKDGGPFRNMGHIRTVQKEFAAIVREAGIAHCTLHNLRATFCTDLARKDVNQKTLQELAGHTSMMTTGRYYQYVSSEAKRAAIEKLSVSAG